MGWKDNLRLVAPVFVALVGFAAAGRFVDGVLVALGAYIVLFGAGQPGPRRLKTFVAVAASMLLSISCGILVTGSFAAKTIAYLAVAVLAVGGSFVYDVGTPGPYFFVLMVGAGTLLGATGMPLDGILPYVLLGNVLATLFGMADLLYDRYGSERRAVAAESAVGNLKDATQTSTGEPGDETSRETMYQRLGESASAIYRAWGAVMSGLGDESDEATGKIKADLLRVHRAYQRLYTRVVESEVLGTANQDNETDPSPYRLVRPASGSVDDLRDSALGEPSLRYRLMTGLTWPSSVQINLLRICGALVAARFAGDLLGLQHLFWLTLVVILVLSYPGDQRDLTLRAMKRFLGTMVCIGVFALLQPVTGGLGGLAYVLVLCALLWLVSRVSSRSYLYGSVFITVLALYLIIPSSPADQAPLSLALERWLDTLIAVLISLAALWGIGSGLTTTLAGNSIRFISRDSTSVLDDLARRRSLSAPRFVEDRRRLGSRGGGQTRRAGPDRT